jgi:hypothetical protein
VFTLAAGKTYRVRGSIGYFAPGSTIDASWRWYNATAGNYIGSSAQINSLNTNSTAASLGGTAEATITPSVATNIVLTTASGVTWTAGIIAGTTTQAALLPWAEIEVIGTTAPLTTIPQVANTLSVSGNITGSNIVLTGGQLVQPIRYARYSGIGTQTLASLAAPTNVKFEKGIVESIGNIGLSISGTGNTTFTNISGGPVLLDVGATIPAQCNSFGADGTWCTVALKRSAGGVINCIAGAAGVNKANQYYNKWDYVLSTPVYLASNGDSLYFEIYAEGGSGVTLTDTNTVGNSTLNITRLI